MLDTDHVLKLLVHYAKAAKSELAETILQRDLVARLIHAADREFGLEIEMTIAVLEDIMRGKK